MRRRSLCRCLAGVVLACLVLAGTAAAQVPRRERRFVYGVNAFAWDGYAGGLSALPAHAIYLLAGHASVVGARETLVYYWPITGEYRADWDSLNEPVAGTLEVWQGSRLVREFAPLPYVIQYPDGPDGRSVLYVGAEAHRRYQAFVRGRARYRDALWRYSEARRRYLEALDRAVQVRQRGGRPQVPQPPPEPPPFRLYSTEVHQGFVLDLPPGRYRIRLRTPQGTLRPESERTVVVFTHRRGGVAFTIVPQRRWTVPERADDGGGTIYARRGEVLYLQPQAAREYPDLAYARLLDPQSREGRPDGWRWVHTAPITRARLEVVGPAGRTTVELRPYRVVQVPGAALGYEVQAARRGQPADFYGFSVTAEGPLRLRLLDPSGRPYPGSDRHVRVPVTAPLFVLFLIPLIPLTLGAAVVAWRREQLEAWRQEPSGRPAGAP